MKKLIVCALLAVPACVLHIGDDGWGFDSISGLSNSTSSSMVNGELVTNHDGEIWMGGTLLVWSRWVEAEMSAEAGASVHVQTANGPIVLEGTAGKGRFSALMWSEFEGDGHIVLEAGELLARGDHGKVFIDEVRGTLPLGIALRAESGTGDVHLRGFSGSAALDLRSGTGDLHAQDCVATSLHGDSGTGDLKVTGGSGERLDLNSGTGDVTCRGARFGQAHLNSGTGDLVATDCDFDRLQLDSGTGDATVRGGHIGDLHHDLGTGDLSWD